MKRRAFLKGTGTLVGAALAPPVVFGRETATTQAAQFASKGFVVRLEDQPQQIFEDIPGETFLPSAWRGALATRPFDVRGFRALQIAATSHRQSSVLFMVGWSREPGGGADELLGFTRLRIWPHPSLAGMSTVVDNFNVMAVPPGAASCQIAVFENPNRDARLLSSLIVRGYKGHVERTPLTESRADADGFRLLRETAPNGAPVIASGVEFTIQDVTAPMLLTRVHKWRPLVPNRRSVLGSLHPKALSYLSNAGRLHALTLGRSDLVGVVWNEPERALVVTVHDYDLNERSVFGTGQVAAPTGAPNVGVRDNPNLGLRRIDRPQPLTIKLRAQADVLVPCWQPEGRLATVILTEHSDYQEPLTEEIVSFGAVGALPPYRRGLAAANLPVTKSIFCVGDDFPFSLEMRPGLRVPFKQASYLGNQRFRDIIDRYVHEKIPFEFGLHTLGTRNHKAIELADALTRCKHLNMTFWIDHGSNESMIMRSGWDPSNSDFYVLRTLLENGIDIVWADGDRYPYVDLQNDLSLVRDDWPSPTLFSPDGLRVPGSNKNITVFNTLTPLVPFDELRGAKLQRAINHNAVIITHTYFGYSMIGFENSFDGRRVMTLKPEAQAMFDDLQRSRDVGDLHVSTIGAWRGLVEAVSELDISPHKDGFVLVNSGQPIKAATFAYCPRTSRPHSLRFQRDDGGQINVREHLGRTYLWLDVPTGRLLVKRVGNE
jgi:hypothetical protein